MLNALWMIMLITGFVVGILMGNIQNIANAVTVSAQEAVDLCIATLGVMVMWCGVMKIAEKAGLLEKLTALMKPLLRFIFPNLPKNHKALQYISTNCVANILGLGWAATPAGLQAMEALAQLEDERRAKKHRGKIRSLGTASNEMCTFLILNISSLQLIPVNIIAYRASCGSVNPSVITGPAIIATTISTAAAIIFCKMMDKKI